MVAAYLGCNKSDEKQVSSLEEISQFMPSTNVSKQDFDAILNERKYLTEADQV